MRTSAVVRHTAHSVHCIRLCLSNRLSSALQTQSKPNHNIIIVCCFVWLHVRVCVCVYVCFRCVSPCSTSFIDMGIVYEGDRSSILSWKICWICAGHRRIKILWAYAICEMLFFSFYFYCFDVERDVVAGARSELVAHRSHSILHGQENMCAHIKE